mmetsp:Transcript_121768/g.221483  ORF Transcript_121768/g.221483 Transcript_121768/m.221483 type:complete len:352 (+) Transcript_121768:133-1188(+)
MSRLHSSMRRMQTATALGALLLTLFSEGVAHQSVPAVPLGLDADPVASQGQVLSPAPAPATTGSMEQANAPGPADALRIINPPRPKATISLSQQVPELPSEIPEPPPPPPSPEGEPPPPPQPPQEGQLVSLPPTLSIGKVWAVHQAPSQLPRVPERNKLEQNLLPMPPALPSAVPAVVPSPGPLEEVSDEVANKYASSAVANALSVPLEFPPPGPVGVEPCKGRPDGDDTLPQFNGLGALPAMPLGTSNATSFLQLHRLLRHRARAQRSSMESAAPILPPGTPAWLDPRYAAEAAADQQPSATSSPAAAAPASLAGRLPPPGSLAAVPAAPRLFLGKAAVPPQPAQVEGAV